MQFKLIYVNIIFLGCLGACNFFELHKVNPDDVLQQELLELRTGGIGEYPLFDACKKEEQKAAQKACFQKQLCDHIAAYLQQQEFYVEENVHDTLWVPLLIDSTGAMIVEDFEVPNFIVDQELSLPLLLNESIQTLPDLQPAHIRGIPVATRYRLPLVLTVE